MICVNALSKVMCQYIFFVIFSYIKLIVFFSSLGSTFVGIAVLGLVLTVLWTIQTRRKNRANKYNVMKEDQ